jgi:hypothetical protein
MNSRWKSFLSMKLSLIYCSSSSLELRNSFEVSFEKEEGYLGGYEKEWDGNIVTVGAKL